MATVTAPGDPDIALDVPTEALAPVAITSLFPAVPKARLPLVAVMSPKVAVRVVPAVTDPETDGEPVNAGSAPVEPARTVPVDATARDDTAFEAPPKSTPCSVTALAETALVPFPVSTPVSVATPVPPPTTPNTANAGSALAPPETRACPVVPAVVPETAEVPWPIRTPWLVRVLAPVPPLATSSSPEKLIVTVSPAPDVERTPAPAILMFPEDGVTTVRSSVVRVLRSPAPDPRRVQLAVMVFGEDVNEVRE